MFKPILFNAKMVQAIQAGRKTQTRRIVKNQDGIHPRRSNIGFYGWDDGHGYQMMPPCKEGDILWVREAYCEPYAPGKYSYRADYEKYDVIPNPVGHVSLTARFFRWKPSIHMPKQAARIFLRVKDVRVERLQSGFSKDGAAILEVQREGVDIGGTCKECIAQYGHPCCIDPDGNTECGELDNPRYEFSRLWDTTIKRADLDKYGWNANPWVWVIEFERCEKPEDWK